MTNQPQPALHKHPRGNDLVLSIVLEGASQTVRVVSPQTEGTGGEIIQETRATIIDPASVQNLSVRLYRTGCGHIVQTPAHRVEGGAIILEVPAEVQQIGTYSVEVSYDVPAPQLSDGLMRITTDAPAVQIVQAGTAPHAQEIAIQAHVLPILKGLDGKDGGGGAQPPAMTDKFLNSPYTNQEVSDFFYFIEAGGIEEANNVLNELAFAVNSSQAGLWGTYLVDFFKAQSKSDSGGFSNLWDALRDGDTYTAFVNHVKALKYEKQMREDALSADKQALLDKLLEDYKSLSTSYAKSLYGLATKFSEEHKKNYMRFKKLSTGYEIQNPEVKKLVDTYTGYRVQENKLEAEVAIEEMLDWSFRNNYPSLNPPRYFINRESGKLHDLEVSDSEGIYDRMEGVDRNAEYMFAPEGDRLMFYSFGGAIRSLSSKDKKIYAFVFDQNTYAFDGTKPAYEITLGTKSDGQTLYDMTVRKIDASAVPNTFDYIP